MWSFIVSVFVFVVLGAALALWHYATKKKVTVERARVDQQIGEAAEVAQRRHKQRFGRASTDLNESLNGVLTHGARGAHVKP